MHVQVYLVIYLCTGDIFLPEDKKCPCRECYPGVPELSRGAGIVVIAHARILRDCILCHFMRSDLSTISSSRKADERPRGREATFPCCRQVPLKAMTQNTLEAEEDAPTFPAHEAPLSSSCTSTERASRHRCERLQEGPGPHHTQGIHDSLDTTALSRAPGRNSHIR
jgi:hypothetical protein